MVLGTPYYRIENEGGDIAVQSIENKGDGVFVVRVAVPTDVDAETLDDVRALTSTEKNPNSGEEKGRVKRSVRFFKGLIAELPTTAKLATELTKLVTAISTLFRI